MLFSSHARRCLLSAHSLRGAGLSFALNTGAMIPASVPKTLNTQIQEAEARNIHTISEQELVNFGASNSFAYLA